MYFSYINQALAPELPTKLPRVDNLDFQLELQIFKANLQPLLPVLTSEEKPDNSKTFICGLGAEDNKLKENNSQVQRNLSNPIQNKQFKLILGNKIESPLCKCKYFSFKIFLKPLQPFFFPREEKVPLEVMIYKEDGVKIMKNMKGTDILRGNFEQSLSYFVMEGAHMAFFRIQVTEVSSHFINKSVSIKIKPKKTEFLARTGWKIKHFCIKNVVVKAKDPKNTTKTHHPLNNLND